MTDPKPRAPRNSKPLTADAIVKKVRAIYATQARRIAELKTEDELEASKLLGRAENEDEHAAARAMLSAVGIVITDENCNAGPGRDEFDAPSQAEQKLADAVRDRLREPLSPERLAVARGGKR